MAALTQESIPALYQLLQQALSPNDSIRKPAEQQLSQSEQLPGFSSCLLEICANGTANTDVRWLAVVCLKNTIGRIWRRRASAEMSDEEKAHLKARMLQLFGEEHQQIAVQLALVVAKIARFDYPQRWGDLITSLVNVVQTAGVPLQSERALLTLHHVLKELASKRLLADRQHFQELAQPLFTYVLGQWTARTEALLAAAAEALAQAAPGRLPGLAAGAAGAHLYLKVLRRLLVDGIPRLPEHPPVAAFLTRLPDHARALCACAHAVAGGPLGPAAEGVAQALDKSASLLMRAAADAQKQQPSHILPFLPVLLAYAHALVAGQGQPRIPEGLLVHALRLLTNALFLGAHRPKALRRQEAGDGAGDPINEFFTEGRIRGLSDLLVARYLPLSRAELAEWEADPEAFVRDQGGAFENQESVRGGAEKLLLTMAEVRREVMGPVAVAMLHHVLGSTSAQAGLPGVLLKDAAYAALGLAADFVCEHVDFPAWYGTHLAREAADRSPDPAARLIRRRAVWLLGCWQRKITDDMRQAVYRQVVEALASGEDLAVQLTAAEALKSLMNDCRFHVPSFGELVGAALRVTLELLARAEQSETKLQLSGALCLLIETVGPRVQPHVAGVLAGLHGLWGAPCEGHSLIKTNVVVAATKLVSAVGSSAPALYDFVLPLVRHATDVAGEEELYLLEDGLELWTAAMAHATEASPALLALYPNVTALLRRDFDHLRECMQLLESYVLLGRAAFMQQHAGAVAEAFGLVVGEVKDRGTIAAAAAMETVLQAFPQEGPPLLEPAVAKFLPALLAGSESDVAAASYLSVLARVLLQSPAYFRALAARAPGPAGQPLLPALLDLWLDKVDCIAAAGKRKLTALALATTLPWGDPAVLARLGLILDVGINVMLEIESSPLDPFGDEWASAGPAEPDEDGVVPQTASETARKAEMRAQDAVFQLSLRAYLTERLAELQRAMGEAAFQALMATVDPAITQQLQAAMAGTLAAPGAARPPPSLPPTPSGPGAM